jgi:hypothetical protein
MHDAKTINGAAWIGRQSHPVFPPSAPQVPQVSIPRFYQINEARDFVLSQVMKEKKAIRETITGDVFFLEHYIPDVVTVAGSNVEYVLEVDGPLSVSQIVQILISSVYKQTCLLLHYLKNILK